MTKTLTLTMTQVLAVVKRRSDRQIAKIGREKWIKVVAFYKGPQELAAFIGAKMRENCERYIDEADTEENRLGIVKAVDRSLEETVEVVDAHYRRMAS